MEQPQHRQGKRNSDVRGLPLLNPSGSNSKPSANPPTKQKKATSTKLPKLNIKQSAPIKEKKEPISLPPLSARSNSSSLSANQDESPRNNKIAIVEVELISEPRDSPMPDYTFLVVQLDKAVVEWKRLYSKRMLQVIVTWLRSQLDQLRYSVVPPSNHKTGTPTNLHHTALFLLQAQLNHTAIELSPSLDDIQDVIHSAGKIMLSLAKGIIVVNYIGFSSF